MMRRSLIVSLVLAAGTLAASVPLASSFLGAAAGLPIPFTALDLPPVTVNLPATLATTGFPIALLAHGGAFDPTLQQLLEGNTVIRTEKQMRRVWKQLFSVPYDAAQFDFDTSFVVLMGGGVIVNGSFTISDVEQAEGTWANVGGPGGPEETLPFVAVTATTFLNGAQPVDPPPAIHAISAVRIPLDAGEDVLFHRALVLGV